MGCIYSCTCSGLCGNCPSYKPEAYCGHAEDVMAQAQGYRDAREMEEEWERAKQKEYDEYERQYCEELEEWFCSQTERIAEQPFSD